MEIKILGTGCSSCKALYQTTLQAVKELESQATVVKEEDIAKIMAYNVIRLPALVIDEEVVCSGKKLTLSDVKQLITK